MSGLGIALTVLVVLVLLALAALFWWLKTQSGADIRSFYGAVRQLEHDQGVQDRYQVPWLLLLGDPREGGQLCADWQLSPVGRPAWFGRWWADPEGALLAVPQGLFVPEEGSTAPLFAWRRLLGLLVRMRAQRPLDGLVWVIPVARLLDDSQVAADGIGIRRRFAELLQRLGLSLPVYVVITGLEEVPGFLELAAALPEQARERTLGWSSPYAPDVAWQPYWTDAAIDQIVQALRAATLEVGALNGTIGDELYRLPERLEALRANLRTLLDPVFQGNALGEAPRLRGLYLTCAQAGDAPSEPWALSARDEPPARGLFARALWRQRLLAEQGLAAPVPRLLRLRQRWQRIAGGVAVVVGLIWSGAMLWTWHDARSDARELARLLQSTQQNHITLNDPARAQEQARRNLQGFWSLLQQAPRWHFSSVVFPTSWLSSRDARMDDLLRQTVVSEALRPLRDVQLAELSALKAISLGERRPDLDGESPEQWPNYVKASNIVAGVVRLEQQNRWLAEALDGDEGVVEPLAQFGNAALGLDLNPSSLRHLAYYESTLRGLGETGPQPLDLTQQHDSLEEKYHQLMSLWLNQYFLADNFVRPAGYLKAQLDSLQAGNGNSLAELEEIDSLIDNLKDMVELTNSAWGHAGGQDLVPGYRDQLERVRQSSVLGPAVVEKVDDLARRLQKGFRDQWVAGVGSRENLLQQEGGGILALQDHVSGLDRAIESLLKRDFVTAALRQQDGAVTSGRLDGLDTGQLDLALGYYQNYSRYVEQELAQIPPGYRDGLLMAAAQAASSAMWAGLSSGGEQVAERSERPFDVAIGPARQVLDAFEELDRADFASALQAALNRRALADVSAALETIDALPLFGQRFDITQWEGQRNLGLQLFRASDVQDLKSGLGRQFAVILDVTETHAPALTWLSAQRNLSAVEEGKVARLAGLSEEMAKYKAQNPSSTPALLEQLVSRDLVEIDIDSCADVLRTAMLSSGQGALALRARALHAQTQQRCSQLQQERAAAAWNELADYFNQYLADRFPFAYSLQADDADPARVQHLVELIDSRLEQARAGLPFSQSTDRLAAEDFLERLKQARAWMGPLFFRDKAGLVGLELDVRWRTDRDDERGADQVIAWGLHAGDRQIGYPAGETQRLRWDVGQPVRLLLRWAKDGTQRPTIDPLQPSMAVSDLEAGWAYDGPWALLRLMREHVSRQRQPSMDYTDFPLTLQVPVRAPSSSDQQALMFMRLSLMTQGGKEPLSVHPLPVRAPRSPFTVMRPVAALPSDQGTL